MPTREVQKPVKIISKITKKQNHLVQAMTEISTGYLGRQKRGPAQVQELWEDEKGNTLPKLSGGLQLELKNNGEILESNKS